MHSHHIFTTPRSKYSYPSTDQEIENLAGQIFSHSAEFISSSAFSPLYGPTLMSIYDYWKNHSFDYTNFVGKVISLLCLS